MEANERQEQLIADSLWVEQAIQFQLNRNDEVLRQIGNEIKSAKLQKDAVLDRFRTILKNNREIQRIAWYDANNKLLVDTREVIPANNDRIPLPKFEFGELDVSEETVCMKPVLEINAKNAYLMHCQIPLIKDDHRVGSIMISYRMNAILEELVPWWFAQDNQITITDIDDRILAERSAGGSGKNVYTHSRAWELPSLTLVLRTNSIKTEPKLLSNLLVLSVILLSIGLIWSLLALWRDINRRLAAEGALRKQVTFRAAMENSLVTGLRARDMEGRLTYVNPAFCRMVGFPAEEIIGRMPPMPYWAPEAIEEYQQRFTQLLAGTVPSEGFETTYQHASGERIPVLIYESALIDEQGKQAGWMSSILDISELRRAQELTRQQEEKLHTSAKLATMGEIASMLAHELNQPLAAISSYTTGAVNLLQAGMIDRSLFQSALEKVNAQAQRAGQIIRSVHEFVKKREAAREPLQIADLIQSAMPLVELQAQASHVALQWKVRPKLPLVLADRVLLEQVLLNLTRNAIEAMQTTAPEKRILRVEAALDEDTQQIIVSVTDRGHGIPVEVAEKLFSPFFTTKSAGMGMGLNICRTAIEFHGGKLSHHENPAGGTIFQFAIPIQDYPSASS
ncbi:PAS domain-containing sensor histidine kinase [Undibacterium sp. YM2]|nr:PAS domain-containing sensor histidine kinase [Undibacterium sp. KW1]BBB65380.1 PAS domain-containing sensor histidine kinase [Undibacterium sp. YM2]